ncbi:MAG: HAD-IA family hydrolase [Nanoarchaeota archaeon]
MKEKAIIFDFDGTIADSLKNIVEAVNRFSEKYGYKKVPLKEIRHLRNKRFEFFKDNFKVSLIKIPFIIADIRKYVKSKVGFIKPQRGIRSLLLKLKKNYKLGIITSNSFGNVKIFLEKNKINFFDYICAERNFFGKGRRLKRFLRKHNLGSNNALYVGDEVRDITAAREAGVKIIAVCWGFQGPVILLKSKPDFLARKPADILKILSRHSKRF